jgi:hypothetical protein
VETPPQKVARLLTALEDLSRQEALQVRSGDYQGAVQTQRRIDPLVGCLAELGAAAGLTTRTRVASVIELRRSSEDRLATALARGREELRQMRTNHRRLSQLRPAYGTVPSGGRQLSARG